MIHSQNIGGWIVAESIFRLWAIMRELGVGDCVYIYVRCNPIAYNATLNITALNEQFSDNKTEMTPLLTNRQTQSDLFFFANAQNIFKFSLRTCGTFAFAPIAQANPKAKEPLFPTLFQRIFSDLMPTFTN